MKKNHILWPVMIACLLIFSTAGTAWAEWKEDRQWKYTEADGSYKTSEWFKK